MIEATDVAGAHGSDIELDSGAAQLHPKNDTGINATNQRFAGGGVTGLFVALAAKNVA
jgi:hypothetical protein